MGFQNSLELWTDVAHRALTQTGVRSVASSIFATCSFYRLEAQELTRALTSPNHWTLNPKTVDAVRQAVCRAPANRRGSRTR